MKTAPSYTKLSNFPKFFSIFMLFVLFLLNMASKCSSADLVKMGALWTKRLTFVVEDVEVDINFSFRLGI